MASTTIRYSGLPGNRQSGEIQNSRPHDPLDPGPYGSPGWYADKRTGRHRRDELPTIPDLPVEAEPIRVGRSNWLTPRPQAEGSDVRRPSPGPTGDEPPEPPEPPVRPRKRFWEDDSEDRYDFGKTREDAWARFLVVSQEFHYAHLIKRATVGDRWLRFWEVLRVFISRVLGLGSRTLDAERPTASGNGAPRSARPKTPSLRAGTPSQGTHRTNPINPCVAQWERHFDERQAFREAVTL
jgi:hypothetical protein